ncbi:MAG: permease prefix domain 1-containing protein [Woeseiaceae bacterium]|nr:permease prefix domain 1-containing protein [Woeseiaceae bacterium]
MAVPDFPRLGKDLLRAGIAPAHAHRAVAELEDHFADLVEASMADGRSRVDAEQAAMRRLGDLSDVLRAMKQQPELRSWASKWPRVALVVYPLACVAALPAAPVIAGVQHASLLGRWLACLAISGIITAFMMLVLQLSITLG